MKGLASAMPERKWLGGGDPRLLSRDSVWAKPSTWTQDYNSTVNIVHTMHIQ